MTHLRFLATVVVLSCTLLPASSQYDPDSHLGTTANIEDVFVGRCWDYDVTKYKGLLPRVRTECATLWSDFFKAFAYKPPCYVRMQDYENFLQGAKQYLPKDKVMLWSGVYNLAHRYSEAAKRYVTLEDSLVGYLANNLTWCGQSIDPGMNLTRCPAWNDCPLEASEAFWAAASKMFATQAEGEVTIMLDGSNPEKPAFRPNSIFGKYELPNMSKNVHTIKTIVTHVLDKPKLETCSKGSLLDLKKAVIEAGFLYTCIDDPPAILHLLCADDPTSRECNMVLRHMNNDLIARKDLKQQHPDFFNSDSYGPGLVLSSTLGPPRDSNGSKRLSFDIRCSFYYCMIILFGFLEIYLRSM